MAQGFPRGQPLPPTQRHQRRLCGTRCWAQGFIADAMVAHGWTILRSRRRPTVIYYMHPLTGLRLNFGPGGVPLPPAEETAP